jgi:hypothetical protein
MIDTSPFRVRCLLCNTVAESWHSIHTAHVPEGGTIGMASCECGKLTVDSAGLGSKYARMITHEPPENWEIITD